MTWRLDGKAFRFTHEGAVATITREESRFYLVVKRNGLLLKEGRFTTLGGAQRMGELMVKG